MKLKHEFPPEFFNEEKVDFVIDRDRKRLWAALLDLLAEFDRVCRKHGIRYSIDGGTMLGKARHNGIIPWDDDIDVIILRQDYERLKEVASEFASPYFLQTMESDPEACRGHPQLRNGSMTMILKSEFKDGKAIYQTFNQGLFMDIFVLDAIPDDAEERKSYFAELTHLKSMMYVAREWRHKHVPFGVTPRKLLNFYRAKKMRRMLAKVERKTGLAPLVWYQQEFEKACRRYEGVKTKCVSHVLFMTNPPASRLFDSSKVIEVEDVEFMGLRVLMLKAWEYYLSHLYGDWHKYVIGGTQHGGLIIDLDRPYTEYF